MSLVIIFSRSMLKAPLSTRLLKENRFWSGWRSFTSISNLSVISKLLERVVSIQLVKYLKDNDILPDHKSAYRVNHSTEKAVLKVFPDIFLALYSGDLAMLTLLALSAAFDSVDHGTLLQRLQASYGLIGVVINWVASYLSSRLQNVRVSKSGSSLSVVVNGLPQGSVLGPILFLLYTADPLQLIKCHQLHPNAFADDTQIYRFCQPSAIDSLCESVHLYWLHVVMDEG